MLTGSFMDGYVERTARADPLYLEPGDNPRLWMHDLLHAVLGASTRSEGGEQTVAIYEAVLLRDDRIRAASTGFGDFGENITLDVVTNKILPDVHRFLGRMEGKFGYRWKEPLSGEEIEDCFEAAKSFAWAFQNHFGQRCGTMSIEQLKAVPVETLLALTDDAPRPLTTYSFLNAPAPGALAA